MNPLTVYRRKTKPTSVNAYIQAVTLTIVGMVLLTTIWPLGVFLILTALFALTLTEGLEIDFTNNRIRIFSGFFGLRFGQWETLPAIERITLVEVNQKLALLGRTNLTTEVSVTYAQVRLYAQESTEYYLASYGTLTAAQADAQVLSRYFGLTYEDYIVSNTQ